MFVFYSQKCTIFGKGPEIGFLSLFSKNAKWITTFFPYAVLDENEGNFTLQTFHFIFNILPKNPIFGERPEIKAFLDLNNLFFSSSDKLQGPQL